MKDFAGSRTTYYSLAREKLRGKHPRILSALIVLVLISMAGFSAFLLSDIVSFGLNSDHRTFLAGLEHQDSIDKIMSIINWNEKSIKSAAMGNPAAQKGRFNNPLEANSSPGKVDTVRLAANKSGDENSSPSRAVNSSRNAKELNLSNSSRTALNPVSSGSTVSSTAGDASSSKPVNDKKASLIKMNHGSSSGTSASLPLKQIDGQGDQKYANKPQAGATHVNATQANATEVNTTLVNATQVSSIQTGSTSTDQLQIKEASVTRSPVYSFSLSQSQVDPTSAGAPLIGQSQTNVAGVDSSQPNSALNVPEPNAVTPEDPIIGQSANEKIEGGSDLSEKRNENIAPEISSANPVAAVTVPAQNSANEAALPTVAASLNDPAKDASAESRPLEIQFKTDSTTSPGSENNPSGENTNSTTVSNANPASSSVTPESSPVSEKKDAENNVSPGSKDSKSNSESPALGGGSASVKKPGATVASKTQKLQEIRYQKIANRNRVAENSKKRAARSRG
ncbi:MAG TPA: hypothetical protein VF300_02250 [Methanothrix sp.]